MVWGSEPQSPLKGQLLYMMTFCFAFYESCLSTVQTGGGGGGGEMGHGGVGRMEIREQGDPNFGPSGSGTENLPPLQAKLFIILQ